MKGEGACTSQAPLTRRIRKGVISHCVCCKLSVGCGVPLPFLLAAINRCCPLFFMCAGAELTRSPSSTYSSGLALKFPRINDPNKSKPLLDCATLEQLWELSRRNNGKLAIKKAQGEGEDGRKSRQGKAKGGGKARASSSSAASSGGAPVVLHAHSDTSGVAVEVDIFHQPPPAMLGGSPAAAAHEAEEEEDDDDAAPKQPVNVLVAPQDYASLLRSEHDKDEAVHAAAAAASAAAEAEGGGGSAAVGSGDFAYSSVSKAAAVGAASFLPSQFASSSSSSEQHMPGSLQFGSAEAVTGSGAGVGPSQASQAPFLLSQSLPYGTQASPSFPSAAPSSSSSFPSSAAATACTPSIHGFVPPEYRSRDSLQRLVKRLGGNPVALREKEGTKFIIAADASRRHATVHTWVEREDMDIIHPCWLVECLRERRRLPFLPRHLVHASAATRAAMELYVDPATGDEHDRPLTSDAEAAALLARAADRLNFSALTPLTGAAAASSDSGFSAASEATTALRRVQASAAAAAAALLQEASGDLEAEAISSLLHHPLSIFRDHTPVLTDDDVTATSAADVISGKVYLDLAADDNSSGSDSDSDKGRGRGAGSMPSRHGKQQRKRLRKAEEDEEEEAARPKPKSRNSSNRRGKAKSSSSKKSDGTAVRAAAAETTAAVAPPIASSGCVAYFDRYEIVLTSAAGFIAPQPLPEPSWLGLREAQYQLYRGAVAHSLDSSVNVVVVDEADVSRLRVIRARLQALSGASDSPSPSGSSSAGGGGAHEAESGGKPSSSRLAVDCKRISSYEGSSARVPQRRPAVPIVSHRWIADSIAAGRQLPVGSYLVNE